MNNTREIKFRAWDNVNKKMLFFSDLSWHNEYDILYFMNGKLEVPMGENINLMQYIGLKDKNGKEIYEGDIIESGNHAIGWVRWRYFGFEQDMINTTGWWLIQEDGEVIGNIYENPELLGD